MWNGGGVGFGGLDWVVWHVASRSGRPAPDDYFTLSNSLLILRTSDRSPTAS